MQKRFISLLVFMCLAGPIFAQSETGTIISAGMPVQEREKTSVDSASSQKDSAALDKEQTRALKRQQKEAEKRRQKIKRMDEKNARLSPEERQERMQELQMEMDSLMRTGTHESPTSVQPKGEPVSPQSGKPTFEAPAPAMKQPTETVQPAHPQTPSVDKDEQRRLEKEERDAEKRLRQMEKMDEKNARLSPEERKAKKQELEEKMYQAVGEDNEKQIEKLKLEMDSLLRVEETEQNQSRDIPITPTFP